MLKAPQRQTVDLFEHVTSAPSRIDRQNSVIRGVKILGANSKNGRTYSPQALRDAVGLYEGIKVNLDHPDRSTPKASRSVKDWVGELRNVRLAEGAVYGDLHLIKSHPYSAGLMDAATDFPTKFGLSHNAEGTTRQHAGKVIVESLKSVRSVDIVGDPATNSSLFESVDQAGPRVKLQDLLNIIGNRGATRLSRSQSVVDFFEEMIGTPPNGKAAPRDGDQGDVEPDQAIVGAVEKIMAVMSQSGLSDSDKSDRIRAILQKYDAGEYDAMDPVDVPVDGADMAESLRTGMTRARRALHEEGVARLRRGLS